MSSFKIPENYFPINFLSRAIRQRTTKYTKVQPKVFHGGRERGGI
jgi:hypothetical protein